MIRLRLPPVHGHAPQHAGAFLLLCFALLLAGCGEKAETPGWTEEHKGANPPPSGEQRPLAGAPDPREGPPAAPTGTGAIQPTSVTEPVKRLRFLSYNIRNYLTMSRFVDGERKDRRKPAREVEALVRIIVDAKPDVLGICEIGTEQDLTELQGKLSEGGLDLPHRSYASGADETRRLALLSRYPIITSNSAGAGGSLTYQSIDADNHPKEFSMQRGILDATVEVGVRQFRFLGVHLKSKREVPEGHQDLMRRHEAYLLRKHADRILEDNPQALLCVYGDLNDTRRESPVRSIQGPTQSTRYLEPLSHKDSRGAVWTHYWDYQHVYSRFDYVLASRALRPLFNQTDSHIVDDPSWSTASDHRALLTIFNLQP